MSHPATLSVAKIYNALRPEAGLVSDAELLRRFATQRDEASFELLLWRHGPMVWGVCRRVLGHAHDAEDVFQASFLALARQAGMIGEGKSLPGWLYRVTLRAALAALKARRLRSRREELTTSLEEFVSNDDPVKTTVRRELAELLDSEIALLPEKFRLTFILCELQGRRRADVAAELRCPVGTVESRLNRARAKLRNRLAKRGLALSLGLITLRFPSALRATTVRLALSSGAAAPASVALLTDHALRSLVPYSLKLALAGVLSACLVVAAVGQAALRVPVNDDKQPSASPVPEPNRETFVVKKDDEPLPKEALARVGSTRFRHADGILSVAYSPDSKLLASASQDGTARVWDADSGKLKLKVPLEGIEFCMVGFAKEGKSMLVVDAQSARLFDLATGKEQTNNPLGRGKRLGRGIRQMGGAVAADGSKFLIRDSTGIQVIDAETGKELHSFSAPNLAQKIEFTSDGKSLVVSSGNEKVGSGLVSVLDVETGKALHEISDEQRGIAAAALSPDGKTLATLSTGNGREKDRVVIWNLKTGKPVQQMDDVEVTSSCLAFSPDGKSLVTGNVQRLHLQLFDVATGKEIK
ncbi:MAG TPA: sigma-70 family RNA polymerase sigma factor, partial [Gemmataceae bacterium]|nr:sigma-70 family RNA polymerase sigma factor [Gemmataceae bacterium]